MFGFAFEELVLVILISILAFGKDLPRVARKAGMFIRRARRYLLDIKEDIERQIPMEELDLQEDINLDISSSTNSGSQAPRPYIPEEDLTEEEEEWDSLDLEKEEKETPPQQQTGEESPSTKPKQD
jgi:sec-independent protein translocase protein TatB|tara:strand:+ start:965 stop:1342 length:378 start_codon:yes stop_codon:yes gene_type:complete